MGPCRVGPFLYLTKPFKLFTALTLGMYLAILGWSPNPQTPRVYKSRGRRDTHPRKIFLSLNKMVVERKPAKIYDVYLIFTLIITLHLRPS